MDKAILIFQAIKMAMEIIAHAMTAVEKIMGAGTGKTKKELVLSMVKTATGDEIFSQFESLFSMCINLKSMLTFGSTGKEPA
jgi:hypothetical protein